MLIAGRGDRKMANESNPIASGLPWPRLDIRRACLEQAPALEFVVANLPAEPGIYGMLVGPDGSRKSWLALLMAVAVASGRPVAGGLWPAPASGRVVFATAEDSANELWRRVQAIYRTPGFEYMADLDDRLDIVPLSSTSDGLTLVTQDGRQAVEHSQVSTLVEIARGSRLIILDPLSDLLDADENDGRAAKLLVTTLRKISSKTGAAVLVVHHQNKAAMLGGETHNQSSRGSSRIPSGSRCGLVVQPPRPEDVERMNLDPTDAWRWTVVTDSKTSYSGKGARMALYHAMGSVPLAREMPKTGAEIVEKLKAAEQYQKAAAPHAKRGKRGLGNLMGDGAEEFDKQSNQNAGTETATATGAFGGKW
jgi:RecA-family ATPase